MSLEIILLLIGIFLSGFFSSSETALFSISKIKALHIAKDDSKTGKLILKMKEDPHSLLTTILIGNNLVNIGASAIATSLAISYFQSNAVGIATGVMTLIILVFGEIAPKSFANSNNVFIARIVIFPLYWLSRMFSPLIFLLNFIPKLQGVVVDSIEETVTEDELMTMVEVVKEDGEIKEEEKELITNIFEFDDTSCSEIMTPRADMFVIDASAEIDIQKILETGYSRIPVIEGTIDNVIGILHVKDLFSSFQKACSSGTVNTLDVKQIMKRPYFIPESKKLDSLLQDFKRKKNHIAVVVDEHGGVAGITTLEDVIEEIIGEIIDETDHLSPDLVRLKGNKWLVSGKIDIDDLNKKVNIEIPESSSYDTFSGFFLEQIGRIPKPDESIIVNNWSVTVKEMDGNRIKNFIVKKEKP